MIHIRHLILSLFTILLATHISSAQDLNNRNSQSRLDNIQYTIKHNKNNSPNVKGSPYINETFEVVKFKKFGDKMFTGRYDANLDEMQIKRDNDTIALNNSENLELTFVLSEKTYKTYNYSSKNSTSTRGFLIVLKEYDSLAILKKEEIKFYEKKPSTSGYDVAKPAEYRRTSDVYYYKLNEKVFILPQKRKDFLKLFPEHSNELKTFIKKNRISLKKDDDLITLFEHIETLI